MDVSQIKAVERTISEWLARVGLELKPSKTRITHTLNQHNGNVGFDFLGFHIRQYRVGRTHSGKTCGRKPKLLGFKTIIKPSKEALYRHYQAIQKIVDTHPTTPQARLIGQLNPIINGWTAYYATVASKKAFSKMDHLTFVKLTCWARQRHPNRKWQWIAQKYWHVQQGGWNFAPPDGKRLNRHSERPIKRHVKVKGEHSPYNGEWVYWAKRMGKHPGIPKRVAILLKRQDGKCAYCGLYFRSEDRMEVDHIIPRSRGGKDNYDNWQLLHTHCHDQKTVEDNSLMSSEVLMTSANLLRSRMS